MEYKYYYRHINKKTKKKYDCSTLVTNSVVFQRLIVDLAKPFVKVKFDKIISQEALGFVFGSAMAYKLKKSFVLLRKGGNLPTLRKYVDQTHFTDYSKKRKTLEINKGLIKKGDRVLIVDDWIETGEQMKAAIRLVEKEGGKVVGIASISAHRNLKTKILFDEYGCKPLNVIDELD
ncbi:phosphoribosyltransferase family protein [Nanoarchaeota archaeon]